MKDIIQIMYYLIFIINYGINSFHWGLGIGDWGLGIGDWGLGPIPNPHVLFNIRDFFVLLFHNIKIIHLFVSDIH